MVDTDTALHDARVRVANRYDKPYHKAAIMRGEWDNGNLVKDELAKVIAENKAIKERERTQLDDE